MIQISSKCKFPATRILYSGLRASAIATWRKVRELKNWVWPGFYTINAPRQFIYSSQNLPFLTKSSMTHKIIYSSLEDIFYSVSPLLLFPFYSSSWHYSVQDTPWMFLIGRLVLSALCLLDNFAFFVWLIFSWAYLFGWFLVGHICWVD